MLQAPPAIPGMREDEIDTPALVIDLDAFEYNLDTMAALLAPTGVEAAGARQDAQIAGHRQAADGARRGRQLRAESRRGRSAGLGRHPRHPGQQRGRRRQPSSPGSAPWRASPKSPSAPTTQARSPRSRPPPRDAGIRMTVLVEIDVGAGRCGVAPGPDAVALAQRIAASKHLIFGGLQAYHGSAQHKRTPAERRTLIGGAIDASRRTVEQLRQQGLDCAIVGGAGTGTFEIEVASGIYNEMQAGSYVFMDADYARNLDEAGAPVSDVPPCAVRAGHGHERGAAGHRGAGCRPQGGGGRFRACRRSGSGRISVTSAPRTSTASWMSAARPQRRSSAKSCGWCPGHCDPTVDRFDWYVGVRNGRVECLWPVAARGGTS